MNPRLIINVTRPKMHPAEIAQIIHEGFNAELDALDDTVWTVPQALGDCSWPASCACDSCCSDKAILDMRSVEADAVAEDAIESWYRAELADRYLPIGG